MASSSSKLIFPLILMALVVFSRTKGLERELLYRSHALVGQWPKYIAIISNIKKNIIHAFMYHFVCLFAETGKTTKEEIVSLTFFFL